MKKKSSSTKLNFRQILFESPFWVVVVLVYGFAIFSGFQIYELYQQNQTQTLSNSELKAELELIKSSRSLHKNDIDLFNSLSADLIPEQEDYFDLIDALERLSEKTGFELYNYSIDLSKTTEEKLSISVAGRGDNDSFFRFLKNYKYSSGRLITIESINFTPKSIHEYTLILNFYHKKIDIPTRQTTNNITDPSATVIKEILGSSAELTENDIGLIREILAETSNAE